MKVRLTREQKIHILNSDDLYAVMLQILLRESKIGRSKEHIWVVCLSNSNRILLIELTSLGTMKKSVVDPTEVFSFALQKRAAKIIIVHNHPGGSMQPSIADCDLTDRMYQAGLFLDMPLIDHLIISEESYYSFADSGELAKISMSQKYVMPYKREEERLKKLGERKGRKAKAVEMAREMKKQGLDPAMIVKISGLPLEQIQKL